MTQQAAEPWQLIETAPKDGTVILVGRRGSEPSIARWQSEWAPGWRCRGNGADADINEYDHEPGSELLADNPSHWRPLPEGPAS